MVRVDFLPSSGTPLVLILFLLRELTSNWCTGTAPPGRPTMTTQPLELQKLGKLFPDSVGSYTLLGVILFAFGVWQIHPSNKVWETQKFKRTYGIYEAKEVQFLNLMYSRPVGPKECVRIKQVFTGFLEFQEYVIKILFFVVICSHQKAPMPSNHESRHSRYIKHQSGPHICISPCLHHMVFFTIESEHFNDHKMRHIWQCDSSETV